MLIGELVKRNSHVTTGSSGWHAPVAVDEWEWLRAPQPPRRAGPLALQRPHCCRNFFSECKQFLSPECSRNLRPCPTMV